MFRRFFRTVRFIMRAGKVLFFIGAILLFPYAAGEKDGEYWLLKAPKGRKTAYYTNLLRIIIELSGGNDD